MADRYIDFNEMLIYGPKAAAAIAQLLKGKVAAFDPVIEYIVGVLNARTTAVQRQIEAAKETAGDLRQGMAEKAPGLSAALDTLQRFHKHLLAHAQGTVDIRQYFPKDGSVSGIGQATAKVLQALTDIANELAQAGTPVRDAAAWQAEFVAVRDALLSADAAAAGAKAARRALTPALALARDEWHLAYTAAKGVAEALLKLTGNAGLLDQIFPDLRVHTPKRTNPDDAPAAE